MQKKFIIKSIVFALIFCITTPILGQFLSNGKNTTVDGFYHEKENTLDVLFFGSSHMYCTVSPNVIWEKTGIPTYNLGQPEQPMWATYHYIKESLKYQNPKAIVVDVLAVNIIDEYMPIANSNRNIDGLKISPNKLELIEASVPAKERPYFLFDLLKTKTNWKEISQDNFIDNFQHRRNETKGFLEGYEVNGCEQTDAPNIETTLSIPEKEEEYLQKIIKLCKEEGIPLVLIKAPYALSEEHQQRHNKVGEIAKENNIEYIDFNQMYDEIGLDFKNDILDGGYHLNSRGARKISEYLAIHLEENYGLENKKNDKKYEQWNEDAKVYSRRESIFELSQEKEIRKYLKRLEDPNYISVMTYNNAKESYYKVLNGEKVVDETKGDNTLKFEEKIDNIDINVKFEFGQDILNINNQEFAKQNNVLNIFVYDKVLNRMVEQSNIDFSNKIKITR